MGNDLEHGTLAWANRRLRSTGRGKHLVEFSYYHVDLVAGLPDVADFLHATLHRFVEGPCDFNVVKLGRTRLSFLLYEHFSEPFPALLTALSCDPVHDGCRFTDYSQRASPPILHRKELLLPAAHPLVPAAVELTARLERLGAFRDTTRIGTRKAWGVHLRSLALSLEDDELAATP